MQQFISIVLFTMSYTTSSHLVVLDSGVYASVISYRAATRLLVIILSLVVDDVEEAELVDTLGGGNDAEPVTELLLLKELLGAIRVVSIDPSCNTNCMCAQAQLGVECRRTGTSGSGRRTPGAR
jgi:hypothetical protein